ncbi:SIMPL domain-containing protein [Parvularcula maris]|uniref:SIMPL domain-containing protein n=1 Tax=Parvularcula maris TaxID=2965077 RepID=A0A9X2LB25_9PROT|nr:SIMPL domain-containing protein [Parvularcula maris]MCQ8186394.1 SIMPL domain-containing protein [Parvularcula maris]
MRHTASAAFALLLLPAFAAAQEPAFPRTISVTGEGEVTAVPDMVQLSFSVTTEAENAAEAFRAASKQMNEVLEAVKDAGVAARDRQTGQLSISPVYEQKRTIGSTSRSEIAGYRASNTLMVRLRDVEAAGEVIDQAVGAGANGLDSFSFGFSEPGKLQDEARIKAVEDAMRKAGDMAEAAGAELGPVITLSAHQSYGGPRPIVRTARMEMAADAAPVIEAGEQSMSITVNAVFALQ